MKEDLDVGHQDDEPAMLKKDVYRICKYWTEFTYEINTITNIIWHPMTRGRLCYLEKQRQLEDVWMIDLFSKTEQLQTKVWHKRVDMIWKETEKARDKVWFYFQSHPSTLQQTVLERPEELQDLVFKKDRNGNVIPDKFNIDPHTLSAIWYSLEGIDINSLKADDIFFASY
jgi:hypothetical protein